MRREADALEHSAFGLKEDVGAGWLAGAFVESQSRLVAAVTDLVELRREAADQLARAATLVEESTDLASSGAGWARGPAHTVSFGQGFAHHLGIDAIARELAFLPSPHVLEVVRDPKIPWLAGAVTSMLPVVGAFLAWRAGQDVLGPAPLVKRADGSGPAGASQARLALDKTRPASVSELIANCALIDTMGGDRRAVVDIAKVTTAHGDEAWVVTLPSTKDWVVPDGDMPAPNDLDAILALALMPGAASTFSRGVVEAIAQAGIPAGAPVLLVGFSLGGMVAADLARSGVGKPSVEGVVAAGAPIDMASDPAGIPVLSLEHEGDVIPTLDLADDLDGPMRVTVKATVSEGMRPHSADGYAATAAAHDTDGQLSTPFARFLATDPATKVEHAQFQIVEPGKGNSEAP